MTTADLVILVPALGRPRHVGPLLDSIERATPGARTIYLCDAGDREQIAAVKADGRADLDQAGGNYAAKINRGIRESGERAIFLGADDLRFQPGWFEAAGKALERAGVVGVNDLIQRRRVHTTHFLVDRAYAERGQIDGKPGLLSEAYEHNFVDDELIGVAKSRKQYTYCEAARVEHLHPMNGKSALDPTYQLGAESFGRDRQRFMERAQRWTS